MKKKIFLVFFTFLAIFLTLYVDIAKSHPTDYYLPRPDGEYDYNNFLVDPNKMDLEQIKDSNISLITRAIFQPPKEAREWLQKRNPNFREEDMKNKEEIKGWGIVIKGNYVITVNHVVNIAPMPFTARGITPEDFLRATAEKIEEHTYIVKSGKEHLLKKLYSDEKEGVAFFELPDDVHFPSFPYVLGDSNKLKIGNFLYAIGDHYGLGMNAREGIVSNLEGPPVYRYIKKESLFSFSNELAPGDSGTTVVAIMDGKYELIGLSEGVIQERSNGTQIIGGWGCVLRIYVFREAIKNCKTCPENLKNLFESSGGAK